MADIKVQRRKKPVGPWIFTLLLLAVVVFGLLFLFRNNSGSLKDKVSSAGEKIKTEGEEIGQKAKQKKDEMMSDTSGQDQKSKQEPQEVKSFVSFAEDSTPAKGMEHSYAAQGLTRLADALESIQEKNNLQDEQINSSINDLKRKAGKLMDDSSGIAIKSALNTATQALENVQEAGFPDHKGEIQELKQTVNEVSEGDRISDQKELVSEFFDESADAVETFASTKE